MELGAYLGNLVELLLRQLGFHSLKILIESFWLRSSSDSNNSILHQPRQEYNSLGGTMRLRYAGRRPLQRPLWTPKGGRQSLERSNLDAFLMNPWYVLVCALKVRMVFNLIDDGPLNCSSERGFDIRALVIANTNRLCFALFLHPFHCFPRALKVRLGFSKERGVDQVPIYAISTLS